MKIILNEKIKWNNMLRDEIQKQNKVKDTN
jgi:hypothetical protein